MDHGIGLLCAARPMPFVLGVLASASCVHLCAEPLIVRDGEPRAEIVTSDKPTRMTTLAARELQTYVEKITGAKLAISSRPSGNPLSA